MAVEKGQKYKSGNYTFTVLSDVFKAPNGSEYIAYVSNDSDIVRVSLTVYFEGYTLIREPKFKVGDRVTCYGDLYEIVSVSPEPDVDGDFGYLARNGDGYFDNLNDGYQSLKAAE